MRQKHCSNCGKTFETHYQWGHHGCEKPGMVRHLNSLSRVDNAPLRAALLKQVMDSLIAPRIFPTVPVRQEGRYSWVKVNPAGQAETTDEPPPTAIGVVTGVSPAQYKTVRIESHRGLRYTPRKDGD